MRLWFTLLMLTSFLNAGEKIALLIGNNDYSFSPLSNPLNDVDGIYKTLKEIGFDISQKDVLKNASQSQMQTALANFSQRAKNAEIALVYFSGHGMQVNNKNYMFPARTTATKPVDLFGLVDLDYFIQSASSAKYGVILVDACRNNPLVKYFQNGKHKGSNAKKGLGQVTPKSGQVVIGFATSAGDTADDGSGRMSPYALALSVRLKENDDIRNVLGKVSQDVSEEYEQNPIYKANLASSVFLIENNTQQYNIKNLDGFALNFASNIGKYICSNKSIKIPFFDDGKIMTKSKVDSLCQNLQWKNSKMKNPHIKSMLNLSVYKDKNIRSSIKETIKYYKIKSLYDVKVIGIRAGASSTLKLYIIKEDNQYYVIGIT